jgi:hypothetical protein
VLAIILLWRDDGSMAIAKWERGSSDRKLLAGWNIKKDKSGSENSTFTKSNAWIEK